MKLRDRLGLSQRRQRQVSRLMEICLVGFLFVGFDRGDLGIVVNAGLALAVTQLPAVLERDYRIPMDAGLELWITTAVFLHALGTLGPYQNVPGWDHVTHTLSSSLVAATGYAFVRAIDAHVDDVDLPPRFLFVFLLSMVVAFGVLWEVVEFATTGLASVVGSDVVLTQYGVGDTLLDLVFDTLGGVVVAVWGTAYLTDVVSALRRHLGTRQA